MSIAEANSSVTAMIQVDVSTDEPYTGNPAGVCILERARDDIWMSAGNGLENIARSH